MDELEKKMISARPATPIPSFLDFEASSLGPDSYPIEVAWSLDDGSTESYLISPEGVAGWIDWSPDAQAVHGITKDELIATGKSPLLVCAEMNKKLAGKTVYTDAPRFDGMWLSKLFAACDAVEPAFALDDVDELLLKLVRPQEAGVLNELALMEAMKAEARARVAGRHRARWDVQYLVELWKLAAWHAKGR